MLCEGRGPTIDPAGAALQASYSDALQAPADGEIGYNFLFSWFANPD